MAASNLGQMVLDRAAESPDSVAFRVRKNDQYHDVTWREASPRLDTIAAGLLTALDLPDDAHIAIVGNTSMDWVLCDFACLGVGLRTVPVYASLLPSEVGYMHVDTQSIVAIVENADQLAKVREMRNGFTFFEKAYTPDQLNLQHIVVIDPSGIAPADDWESLEALEARGAEKLEELKDEFERRRKQIERSHTATYTYTSGTTGPPKAVIQTHHNMLTTMESTGSFGLFNDAVRDGGLFLFLPLAHSFGRLVELAGPYFDSALIISSVPTLAEDLLLARPGFFPSAPRVYEKMKAKIESRVAGAPPLRKRLFNWALGVGKSTIEARSRGKSIPFTTRMQHRIADRLVLGRLREALGLDQAALLLSGSAPLSVDVHEFFLALGLDLVEGYGLTETCPALTCNRPHDFRLGTVGKAIDGVTLRIAEDGEICAKGGNITSGYLNREAATRDAFDEDGWFCTGDLGSLDSDGFLKITGRKKELIKTSGGKYVAPAKLEGRLKSMTMVQEAVVVGDKRNYCVAIISLDPEDLSDWAQQNDAPNDPASEEVRKAVQAHVDEVNDGLASFESIKYFRILGEPMTVENGILTASLKVKRRVVEERFADLIDDMYNQKRA